MFYRLPLEIHTSPGEKYPVRVPLRLLALPGCCIAYQLGAPQRAQRFLSPAWCIEKAGQPFSADLATLMTVSLSSSLFSVSPRTRLRKLIRAYYRLSCREFISKPRKSWSMVYRRGSNKIFCNRVFLGIDVAFFL